MIKKLIGIDGSQQLGKAEQINVIGGYVEISYCDEENPCRTAGTCCSNGVCIPKIDKRGNYLFCDSL